MSPDTTAAEAPWRWRTVPNLIILLRFVLIIPIVILVLVQTEPHVVALLAGLFGATDWVDGYLARRLDQFSRVGEIIDPIADRVGISCVGIALTVVGAIPLPVLVVIVVVDLIVVGASLIRRGLDRLEVSRIGKARTAVIMISVCAVTVGLIPEVSLASTIGQGGLAVGAVLHVVAGAGYLRQLR